MREISSIGVSAPVDVSACTIATSLGRPFFRAASIAAGSIIFPHSASTFLTFAPQRSATSHILIPNTPFTPMTTSSPGSTKLTKQVSIPALPVPLIGNVISFSVLNTSRSIDLISSIILMKSASRCPIRGELIAFRTEGATLLGPGPSRSLLGGEYIIGVSISPMRLVCS